jgi:hypothetical protein
VLAATLCAFDPNILAHGRLATTDLGLTCFVLLAVWAYRRLTRTPTVGTLVLAGAMLGLALLAKFSGLFLLGLLVVWGALLPFVPGAVSIPHAWRSPWAAGSRGDRAAYTAVVTIAVIALALLVVSLGYLAPGRVDRYFRDFLVVNVNVNTGFMTYFKGVFHAGPLPYYFLAAFLLKTPLALLAMLGVRAAMQVKHREEGWADRILLLSPVVLWFTLITWQAFQIGLRYVLPVYPFLFVYASGIAASPLFAQRRMRLAVYGLALWFMASSLASHPHYLPYFNEVAGGPSHGIEWLDDSNVDWGQDLILLRGFLAEHRITDANITPMALYPPTLYGLPGTYLPAREAVRMLSNPDPTPGVYAVSAHLLNRAKLTANLAVDPLKDLEPMAIVGHSIYVFDLR